MTRNEAEYNLRLCAWCCGNFLEQAYLFEEPWHPGDQPEWFCKACTRKIAAGWDPKVGGVVKLLRGYRQAVRPVFVVLGVDGEMFRLRRLGFPEGPTLTVHRGQLDPFYPLNLAGMR